MATQSTGSPSEIWRPYDLDGVIKSVTVLAAFAYVIGVIAINTYLHKLGIVDFSFAKPKLLLTGIMALFSFLILAVPSLFYAWSIANNHSQTDRKMSFLKRMLAVSFLVIFLIVAAPLCFNGRPGMGQTTVWELWNLLPHRILDIPLTALIVTVEIYLPISIAAVSVYRVRRLLDEVNTKQARIVGERYYHLAVLAAVFVTASIGYICIFTYTFYSVIPQDFGGGRPYFQSYAVANTTDRQNLQQIGIPFLPTKPNVTMPLPVLHETDTMVAVWLNAARCGETGKGEWDFVVVQFDKKQFGATVEGYKPLSNLGTPDKFWLPEPPYLSFMQCQY